MERIKDRYRHDNEIANERWFSTQDPGKQTRAGAPTANGQTSFSSTGGGKESARAASGEDAFDIQLLGFSQDPKLDALYDEAEAMEAKREAGEDQDEEQEGDTEAKGNDEDKEEGEPEDEAEESQASQATHDRAGAKDAESSPEGQAKQSRPIPDLPEKTTTAVSHLIRAGNRQRAINTLVGGAKRRGRINPALLHRRRMRYDADLKGEGLATPPRYIRGKALPTKVAIGPAAFNEGLSWLYSTLLHEYQHVLQFQASKSSPSKVPGQGNSARLINQQETEAYAREVLLSRKTGLARSERLIRETWQRLQSYWGDLSKKAQKPLRSMVAQARKIYERVT